ncbi:MAG: sigma-70 family RNA polymerase sigma factor [Ilumatobacter sp.]|nr:sigma-70 family RNA polymerase sigma factor [Ilumatobacter sp.]
MALDDPTRRHSVRDLATLRELESLSGEECGVHGDARGRVEVEALFRAHSRELHLYCARRLGDDMAFDVTAEVFRIALEGWEQFDGERGSGRAWLYGIASNLIRRHWRTEQRRLRALAHSSAAAAPPVDPLLMVDDRLSALDDMSRVLLAAAELNPDDHEVLVLFAWEGWSYNAIAAALDVPVGTVRSRLHRARRQLAAALSEEVGR